MERHLVLSLAHQSGLEDWTGDGNWRGVDDDLLRFAENILAHDKLTAALAARDGEVENLRARLFALVNIVEDAARGASYCQHEYIPTVLGHRLYVTNALENARAALLATAKEST